MLVEVTHMVLFQVFNTKLYLVLSHTVFLWVKPLHRSTSSHLDTGRTAWERYRYYSVIKFIALVYSLLSSQTHGEKNVRSRILKCAGIDRKTKRKKKDVGCITLVSSLGKLGNIVVGTLFPVMFLRWLNCDATFASLKQKCF